MRHTAAPLQSAHCRRAGGVGVGSVGGADDWCTAIRPCGFVRVLARSADRRTVRYGRRLQRTCGAESVWAVRRVEGKVSADWAPNA